MSTIFVGGSQRSGTTLLNKFICLNPNTNPKLAEASYLRELMSAYANALIDFEHDTCDYFRSKQELAVFHSQIINLFLNHVKHQHSSTEHVVLKEPHLTQYFPLLHELVPHARFILIARDPRDIISSMITVGEKLKQQGQYHFFQERNMQQLCQHVMSFYAPSVNNPNASFKNHMLAIRYEDLILNTQDIQQRLKGFTGLDFNFASEQNPNESMDRELGENQPRYLPWVTENNDKPINDSSIGSYKNTLSDDEIEQINKELEGFMQLFHYSPQD